MVGTTLQGRYAVEHELATGGMGAIFVAVDERLGRKVAVKVLKDSLASDPSFVERFRREARAVAALSHPNVAGVYDYGRDDDLHFIVMELIEGKDLARVLREEGPLSTERAVDIGKQIAAALGHAHSAGIVHRDIKPANVIVGRDGRVKVTDFGIARAHGDATLTATGSVLGTSHYLSPEQAAGGKISPATDVYALGVVLYEMLTGSVPFTGDSPIAIAMRHVSDELPAPSELNPDVPSELDRIVARATAKDPNARFADGSGVAAALGGGAVAALAAGTTREAAPTAAMPGAEGTEELTHTVWPIPDERWDPKKVGRAVLLVFLALLLVAGGLLLMRLGAGNGTEEQAETQRQPAMEPPAPEPEPEPEPTPEGDVLPDVIGWDRKDAEERLKGMGLEVKKEDVESDRPKDEVVDTVPAPGSPIRPGATVTLFVSEGPEDDNNNDNPGRGRGRGRGGDD